MSQPDDGGAVLRLALTAPDLDLVVDPDTVLLTPHAVQRYRERIEGVSTRLAIRRLRLLVATARWRSRPAAWPRVVLHPDVIYGYCGRRPETCLLLRKDVLITVLARDRLHSIDLVEDRCESRSVPGHRARKWAVPVGGRGSSRVAKASLRAAVVIIRLPSRTA
jgi:hypothetical protein